MEIEEEAAKGATVHQPRRRDESSSQPVFARERIRKLLQIFAGVDRRIKNGWPIAKAIRYAARRWRGKTFKSCPGRACNFSEATLSRIYYAWRNAGRDAAVLELHYVAPARKRSPALGLLVLEHAVNSDVQSAAAAIRLLNASGTITGARPGTFRRSVTEKDRVALKELFEARATAGRAVKRIKARVQKGRR